MLHDKTVGKRPSRVVRALLVLFMVYTLFGVVVIPLLAKRQAVVFLEQRLGGQAQIDAVTFNPFTFSATIAGMQLSDIDEEPLTLFDSVFVNFEPSSFLSGEIEFSEIAIDGFHINLHRYPDGDNNIARLMLRWSASAQPPGDEAQSSPPGEAPSVRVGSLRVNGASVGIIDDAASPPFITLVESIDFALDDLSTEANVEAEQRLVLATGEGSQLRWTGELTLLPLRSSGEIQLFGPLPQLAYRYFQEQLPVALVGGWFDASLAYDFSLTDAGELDVRVSEIEATLSNLDVRDTQAGTLLVRLPTLSAQGGSFDLLQRQAAVDRVLLERVRIDAERTSDGVLNLQAAFAGDAQSDITAPQAQNNNSPEAAWRFQLAQLALENWDLRVRDLQPEQALSVNLGFNAIAMNISNIENEAIRLDTDLTLSSGGSLRVGGSLNALPEFGFAGEINLEALALPLIQPYLASMARIQLDSGIFNVAGNITATPTQSEFSGDASLNTLLITDTGENEMLFGLSSLQFESSSVSLGEVTRIDVGVISVQAPYARIQIDEDGSNNISRVLIAAPQDSLQAAPQSQSETETAVIPPIRIEQVLLEQGSADFSDRSLPLPFAVNIEGLGGIISALSTRSSEPARISLEGQVDEYGLASITGRLRPMDYADLTEIDMAFSNLSIPSLSPYVIKFAGRRVDDGVLDVDLSYRINAGQLNGENAMVMRDLVLGERIEHPDAMDLPLGLAIALLKDSAGVIDLNVPVSGALESPEFSYGSVIRTALGNIIRSIVASPFRFLANLVGGDEDSDIGVIEFVPGRADLQPPERQKLAQLADALLQRPQLRLGLLGRYAQVADSTALQELLFEERFNARLQALQQQDNAPAPTLLRLQLLEQFAGEQAEDNTTLETYLQSVRQEYTSVDSEGLEQFDDLAYAQTLRRELIAQQQVATADLEQLAQERVEAIANALGALDASLTSRVQALPAAQDVALEDERVPLALELTAM